MTAGRRLRVLVGYPGLGNPGDTRDGHPHAQAHVDLGNAEWIDPAPVERGTEIETSSAAPMVETAVRPPARTAKKAPAKKAATKRAAPPETR